MSKTVLYVAMSLDGYLADSNGGVEWLHGDGSDPKNEGTYPTFLNSVKYVIMGYRTYHQLKTELSPEIWPYTKKECYVLTHRSLQDDGEVRFRSDLRALVEELRNKDDGDVWICGGTSVITQLLNEAQIDVLRLALIPITLGKGIVLFEEGILKQEWILVDTVAYDGIVEVHYRKRHRFEERP